MRIKKVILYGIRGAGRKEIEYYLSNEYEIIGYSDSATEYQNCQWIDFKRFYKKEELKSVEFDYCIITPKNVDTAKECRNMLITAGISWDKLLEYALFCDVWGTQYPHPYEIYWGGGIRGFHLMGIF